MTSSSIQVERNRFEASQFVQCEVFTTKNKAMQTEIIGIDENVQTEAEIVVEVKQPEIVKEIGSDLEKQHNEMFFHMVI